MVNFALQVNFCNAKIDNEINSLLTIHFDEIKMA